MSKWTYAALNNVAVLIFTAFMCREFSLWFVFSLLFIIIPDNPKRDEDIDQLRAFMVELENENEDKTTETA